MSLRIKKGDKIQVLAGKDKGKTGTVLKSLLGKNRVIVEGVNLSKKHMRRRSEAEAGGIKEIPSSIHISNVNIFCPSCSKGTVCRIKILEDKTKVRICRKCNKPV